MTALWERTGASGEKQYSGQIRHKEFAERLQKVADQNPNVPPMRHGRLTYVRDELGKRGQRVSLESVRKWFAGESMPHKDRVSELAEILKCDESWLIFGTDPTSTPQQRRMRNALVDGAVNFVAGLAQMDGAAIAFPEEGDRFAIADHIDLHAIIRGASYPIHVLVGDDEGKFHVPTDLRNTVPIGVIRQGQDGFRFTLYEITDVAIEMGEAGRTGKVEVPVTSDGLREIVSFKDRF